MRALAIGPREAFVFSRVDGHSSEVQIAQATGLDLDDVVASLARLHELGAIAYDGELPPPVSAEHSKVVPSGGSAADTRSNFFVLFDPRELDEPADISPERKQRILETYYALEESTHYELLQVPADADKKSIKAAYFQVVNLFHPDRYFGKQLGSFKSKLERIFARMTEAEQVLTRKATRAEYDAYLATRRQTSQLNQMLSNESALNEELERAREQIEREAQHGPGSPQIEDGSTAMARPSRPTMRRVSDPEIRKRALARKLRGAAAPLFRASGPVPAVQLTPGSKDDLRDKVDADLKARYESRRAAAQRNQVGRYLEAADKAEANNDPVSAANALRIAHELDPHNELLSRRLSAAQLDATRALADSYLQQAQYEEREGQLERAARNYEKAAAGKGNPALYDRAASCLLSAAADMKYAGDLARKAVELAPERAEYRITLARIYACAKMLNSAVKEAERAVKLAPNSEATKTWLKRIKRGEF